MTIKRIVFNVVVLVFGILMILGSGGGGGGGTKDTTSPVITLEGENPLTLIQGTTYVELGAIAFDDVDGNLSVAITGDINSSKDGNYTIVYRAKDSSGNQATVNREINVIEQNITSILIMKIENRELNVDYVCRKNDEMEITGFNLLQQSDVSLNFTDINGTVTKLEPLFINEESITFECPSLADGFKKFNLEYEDINSSVYNIQFINNSSPTISTLSLDENILTIEGENLDKSFTLYINEKTIPINNSAGDSETISNIELSKDIESGYAYLENNISTSNRKYLNIKFNIFGQIELSDNIKKENILIFNQENESTVYSNGNFDLEMNKHKKYNIIFAEKEKHSYYSTIIFSENDEIILNSLSTAVSLVWINLYLYGLDTTELKSLRSELYKLEEIKTLANLIEEKLKVDSNYLDKDDRELEDKISIALEKSIEIRQSIKNKINKTSFKSNSTNSIEVTPSSYQGVSFEEQKNGSGNLILLNDTAVPLSLQVIDKNGKTLHSHIKSSWGLGSYSGQDILFNESRTSLNVPNGHDCDIEVLTAGSDNVFDPEENEVISSLRKKMVLDIIWSYVGNILPSNFTKTKFLSIIGNPDFFYAISQGKYTDAKQIAIKNLQLYSLSNLAEENLKKPLDRVLKKLPLLKLGQHLNQIYDYFTTDSKMNFEVKFPLVIQEITPNKLLVNQTTEDGQLYITLKGTGLHYNLNFSLFQKGGEDIQPEEIRLGKIYSSEGWSVGEGVNEIELSVDLDSLRYFFDEHLNPLKSSTRILASLRISDNSIWYSDEPKKKDLELIDVIEINNDLSIDFVNPEGGIGGDEIVLRGTGFNDDASENIVALGHMKDGRFEVKYYLKVKEVSNPDGTKNKVILKIPSNVEVGTYELRANTFESIHWSNSVDFKIFNMDIDIESVYPKEINIEEDTIVSVFLSCHDDENKTIDCNMVSRYKASSREWFNHDYFLTYHKNHEFVIEFKGLSKYRASKFLNSQLVDIKDDGNHLRFKILSEDMIDPKLYKEGHLFTTPFISTRLIMNAENKVKKIIKDKSVIVNQKFGTLGYYDSFIRSSSPSENPESMESDNGKVGKWEDALSWIRIHNRYGGGIRSTTFNGALEYCSEIGMQLPTYQDFSKLIDPSRENLTSSVFLSYFFHTYYPSKSMNPYWLRNGNRIVQHGFKIYEQKANEISRYSSTYVKCIQ